MTTNISSLDNATFNELSSSLFLKIGNGLTQNGSTFIASKSGLGLATYDQWIGTVTGGADPSDIVSFTVTIPTGGLGGTLGLIQYTFTTGDGTVNPPSGGIGAEVIGWNSTGVLFEQLNGYVPGTNPTITPNGNYFILANPLINLALHDAAGKSMPEKATAAQLTFGTTGPFPGAAIFGTVAGQTTTDTATVTPLSGVTVNDIGSTPTETVTVTLSAAANGALSNLGTGSYDAGKGIYTIKDAPSVVTTTLDGLVFTPTKHQSAAGQTVTTTFTIKAADAAGLGMTDSTTAVLTTESAGIVVPTIAGTVSGQTTTDQTTIKPFANVVIADLNVSQTETVTITLSAAANGTLTNLGNGSYDTKAGVYTDTGTAATVTADLNGIVFTPTPHQAAPGQTTTTGFSIKDSDTAGKSATDNATSVVATAAGVVPIITGTAAGQTTTDQSTITPFSKVTITDANTGQTETLTVTLSAPANGTLTNLSGGTYDATKGIYTATGSAAAVTLALDGLVFTPTAHQAATTTFTIADTDTAAATVTDNTTTVIVTPSGVSPTITGTVAGQPTTDQATIKPFSKVTIGDQNPGQTESVIVTLSSALNGTLTNLGGGSYNTTTGIYTDTGSAATVTSDLDNLVFTPTAGQTVTTTFTIKDTDTAGGIATDNKTTVIATAGSAALTITGTVAGQATTDQTPITPFPRVVISDPTAGQTENVTVTLSAPGNGTLTNLGSGTYDAAKGVYGVTGTAAAVTTALDGLVFKPTVQQAAAGQTVTTTFTIKVTDTATTSATDSTASVVTTETGATNTGLLGTLNVNQQLELIYIAYFNRAADGGGFGFWGGQNVQAQNAGQTAAVALTNIANSFTPQPETIALYPFLGTPNLNLNTPAAQAGLTTFINSLYQNLFVHAPDTAGQSYWVGQITAGAVGLGAAALAIANGATGSDAIEVRNKLAVALDFSNRTTTAGLGVTPPYPASFVTNAGSVLNNIDATSLDDASVTSGMNATTTYIASATTTHGSSLPAPGVGSSAAAPSDPSVITVTGTDQLIDPGTGNHTIQFLPGASSATLVLRENSLDQVYGFDPSTDVLDLRSLLSQANINLNDGVAALGNYLSVTDQNADAVVNFDPTGHAGGNTVAVLHGLGSTVTGLNTLIAQGAIRFT